MNGKCLNTIASLYRMSAKERESEREMKREQANGWASVKHALQFNWNPIDNILSHIMLLYLIIFSFLFLSLSLRCQEEHFAIWARIIHRSLFLIFVSTLSFYPRGRNLRMREFTVNEMLLLSFGFFSIIPFCYASCQSLQSNAKSVWLAAFGAFGKIEIGR